MLDDSHKLSRTNYINFLYHLTNNRFYLTNQTMHVFVLVESRNKLKYKLCLRKQNVCLK